MWEHAQPPKETNRRSDVMYVHVCRWVVEWYDATARGLQKESHQGSSAAAQVRNSRRRHDHRQ